MCDGSVMSVRLPRWRGTRLQFEACGRLYAAAAWSSRWDGTVERPAGAAGIGSSTVERNMQRGRWPSDSTTDYRVEPLIPIPSAAVAIVAADLADGSARYLDCRSEEEYAAGVVPGSTNLPYPHNGNRYPIDAEEFVEDVLAEGFERGEKIYLGCRKGPRSAMACEVLINAGFTGVRNVEGGIQEWVAKGLPIHPFTG